MKKERKEKFLIAWKKFVSYFTMYALLPLLCGAGLALLILIRQVGAEEASALFSEMGEQSVEVVLGGKLFENQQHRGFYFLSSKNFLPLGDHLQVSMGSANYFMSQMPHPSPPSPKPEEKPLIYYDSLPAGATPVIPVDLSSRSPVLNSTNYSVDLEKVRRDPFPSSVIPDGTKPLVLVLHSHGTECYFEDNTNLSDFATDEIESYFVEGQTFFRTQDTEKNVVRVGKVFSDTLNRLGIPTIHCTVMHDRDDYNNAYTYSAETVKAYLKEYPSIQYVIDLHRDSVVRGNAWVKTRTEIEGKESAQVMLVVGTNQNGRHPNWEKNLVVATAYKDTMDTLYPSLARSMYLRTARFNQEYLPGCMLLEVGSAANSLEEAETAAVLAAKAFASMLQARQ